MVTKTPAAALTPTEWLVFARSPRVRSHVVGGRVPGGFRNEKYGETKEWRRVGRAGPPGVFAPAQSGRGCRGGRSGDGAVARRRRGGRSHAASADRPKPAQRFRPEFRLRLPYAADAASIAADPRA